jgi:hypothetical protein
MTTGWGEATKMLATMAALAVAALSIGCGPAPGYEPEPRMPQGYVPIEQGEAGEPLSSAELAARQAGSLQGGATPEVAQATGEIAIGGADTEEYGDTDPSALTEWKPALEGHGEWVDDSTYGTVWVPSTQEVGADFQPYVSAGHWTYDDSTSWVWVSDYSWGWAPFHYGRWAHVGHRGWAWIPGRTYSGAWVTWRTGASDYDYVGWAPMGPDWYWYHGVAVGWTFGWSPSYVYCHHDRLYDHGLYGHVVRGPGGREMEGHTRPYSPGPGRVAAAPTVGGGGRVAATPSVGAGRVAATPSVGGRVGASPTVGPHPSEIGIRAASVVRPPSDNAGLARATAFASPRTAVAQGAAPPGGVRRRTGPAADPFAAATAPSRGGFDRTSPAASARMEAAARAPQFAGAGAVPPHQSAMADARPVPRGPSAGFGTTPGMAAAAPSYRSSIPSQPSHVPSTSFSTSPPSYRPAPSAPSPSYRPSPSFSGPSPSYRSSPSFSQPSPSYRSAPSAPSPSYRSSPSMTTSSPSYRSSSPSHSTPSVSSPSRSAPSHSSTPSRSSGSRGGRR